MPMSCGCPYWDLRIILLLNQNAISPFQGFHYSRLRPCFIEIPWHTNMRPLAVVLQRAISQQLSTTLKKDYFSIANMKPIVLPVLITLAVIRKS